MIIHLKSTALAYKISTKCLYMKNAKFSPVAIPVTCMYLLTVHRGAVYCIEQLYIELGIYLGIWVATSYFGAIINLTFNCSNFTNQTNGPLMAIVLF